MPSKHNPCGRCGCHAKAWDGLKHPIKWVCGICRYPLTLAKESRGAELKKDAARIDHIESRKRRCNWVHKSWISRYYSPELVNEPVGSRWDKNKVTRATAREALDDEIKELAQAKADEVPNA